MFQFWSEKLRRVKYAGTHIIKRGRNISSHTKMRGMKVRSICSFSCLCWFRKGFCLCALGSNCMGFETSKSV